MNNMADMMMLPRNNELITMIVMGDNEKAKELLNLPVYESFIGPNLLQYAVSVDNEEITQELLNRKVAVNSLSGRTRLSPLITAIMRKSVSMVRLLLSAGADIFYPSVRVRNAFKQVLFDESLPLPVFLAILEVLRERLDSPNEIAKHLSYFGASLYQASGLRDIQIIDRLSTYENPQVYGINSVSKQLKRTALHMACLLGDRSLVDSLIARGADVNVYDVRGVSPLYCLFPETIEHTDERKEIVKVLVPLTLEPTKSFHRYRYTGTYGNFQISRILATASSDLVRLVLEMPTVKFDARDHELKTVLHTLAMNTNPGIAKVVDHYIERMEIDARDYDEATPLYYAAKSGSFEMVQYLLDMGADREIVNLESDMTPLVIACCREGDGRTNDYVQCLQILIMRGANPFYTSPELLGLDGIYEHSPVDYIPRFKVLAAHMAILDESNATIPYEMKWNIVSIPEILAYYVLCKRQLERKFKYGLTLHELLTMHEKQLERYAHNVRWVNMIRRHIPRVTDQCDYYRNFAQYRIDRAFETVTLKSYAVRFINHIGKVHLDETHIVVEEILKYWDRRLLIRLREAHRIPSS